MNYSFFILKLSEQSRYLTVFVHVDIFRGGLFRQSWHRHDIARQHDNESRAGGDFNVSDSHGEALGRAEQRRVVRKAVLRFRHAHGQVRKA